jgi:hypothetical protein
VISVKTRADAENERLESSPCCGSTSIRSRTASAWEQISGCVPDADDAHAAEVVALQEPAMPVGR